MDSRYLLLVALMNLMACGGGVNSAEQIASVVAPPAPSINAITARDASAIIAFDWPTTNGGATISRFEATCKTGTDSKSEGDTQSPITLTGLTNNESYVCTVTATNSAGIGPASCPVTVTLTPGSTATGSTAGVACDYNHDAFNDSASVNLMSIANWSCGNFNRVLSANGVRDHDVGAFPNPNNPNAIAEQNISATYNLSPQLTSQDKEFGGHGEQ